MEKDLFRYVGMTEDNPKWDISTSRINQLYKKQDDIRTDFERDYTRILHSTAYRRLKHKTQVFFATRNDHICTRIEHVNHVASVSYTIATFLGLNHQLTNAIAIGHDLGHAPFGHAGENILKEIAHSEIGETFWHERNSLRFVDKIETLQNKYAKEENLKLTYAVRDGIISHCGEVNETALFPRNEPLDLAEIERANQYMPFTWEGCIVKIADKISYLGRDIEDAVLLRILSRKQLKELRKILKVDLTRINNTILIHDLIIDLCTNSTPENGIRFSEKHLELMNAVKDFNYTNIYNHHRLKYYKEYARIIITSIYDFLIHQYANENTLNQIMKHKIAFPNLAQSFSELLIKYSNIPRKIKRENRYVNDIIYDINNEQDYSIAIIDYISGMTDSYATTVFHEITSF